MVCDHNTVEFGAIVGDVFGGHQVLKGRFLFPGGVGLALMWTCQCLCSKFLGSGLVSDRYGMGDMINIGCRSLLTPHSIFHHDIFLQ